jgi:hypothetical protein
MNEAAHQTASDVTHQHHYAMTIIAIINTLKTLLAFVRVYIDIECHDACLACYGKESNQCTQCAIYQIYSVANSCTRDCSSIAGYYALEFTNYCINACPHVNFPNTFISNGECLRIQIIRVPCILQDMRYQQHQ